MWAIWIRFTVLQLDIVQEYIEKKKKQASLRGCFFKNCHFIRYMYNGCVQNLSVAFLTLFLY